MTKQMSEGQRAYEEKRAAKAGMSLDKWLSVKDREKQDEARSRAQSAKAADAEKKPGFFSRLIERAHKPL